MKENSLPLTRRQAIGSMSAGSLLWPGIVAQLLADERGRTAHPNDPFAPRSPQANARAQRVIVLFMQGGMSHVDTFDFKPQLLAKHGKTVEVRQGGGSRAYLLKRPQWPFQRYGAAGIEVSSLFPHLARCVDDLCVIRSMTTDSADHTLATQGMHTGSVTVARPSMGAWISYGLGTFNRDLPSFVVISPRDPRAGNQIWSADFLPGYHQGTRITPGQDPIPNLRPNAQFAGVQRDQLELLAALNRRRDADEALAARIATFETAFRMQRQAGAIFDLSDESDATLNLYGLTRDNPQGFAWQCLVARRLAERGVRFVELIDAPGGTAWDAHIDMADYNGLARNVDQAIAGLLIDLKQRGMLDDTLVVFCTEFGRTPFQDANRPDWKGRDHHAPAFTCWLAGGGVRAGTTIGATDDFGIQVAENPVHFHDFHATILHLLGLDHTRLTFRHAGRDFRLTDVHGRVVREALA